MAVVTTIFKVSRHAHLGHAARRMGAEGLQALDFLFAEGEFAFRSGQPLPTVVMLDLNLPRIGGLEVLERLRADERTRLLPVVILTSTDEQRDRVASYRNGANSFVRKPLDFGEFAETVARLGVYWLATNEPPEEGEGGR